MTIEEAREVIGKDVEMSNAYDQNDNGFVTRHQWIRSDKWYQICAIPMGLPMLGVKNDLSEAVLTVLQHGMKE